MPGIDVGERLRLSDVKHECDPVGLPVQGPRDSCYARTAYTVAIQRRGWITINKTQINTLRDTHLIVDKHILFLHLDFP